MSSRRRFVRLAIALGCLCRLPAAETPAAPGLELRFVPPSGGESARVEFGPIEPGHTYLLDYSTALDPTAWKPATAALTEADGRGHWLVDLGDATGARFFRVRRDGHPLPSLLAVENHWVANSGGRPAVFRPTDISPSEWNGNAGNALTGIAVREDPTNGIFVHTTTNYDETGLGNAPDLGAVYQDGACVGKSFWVGGVAPRQATSRDGTRQAEIVNFYGRAFFFKLEAPPDGADAPYVQLGDGRRIDTVEDPTALSFDLQGRLWIADNGPDQNIKIFDLAGTQPALVGTFGEAGGVFAGPVPGTWGPLRFWGPRGLAHDSLGNVYVGCTGMSMLMMGGTDLRAFDPDGQLLWHVAATFTNSADADPASDGTSIYLNAKRYEMDYTQPPGKSWRFAAVTLDPFRFPDDLRLRNAMESVWVRRIEGRRFLFLGNMVGGFLYLVRFEEGSEIGIPTAFFYLGESGRESTNFDGLHPTWEATEGNKNRRWRWLDGNGDGHPQVDEFEEFEVGAMIGFGVDVDREGNIWYGGRGAYSEYFRDGGLVLLAPGGLDEHGVPRYPLDQLARPPVPYAAYDGNLLRMHYLPESDTMFLGAADNVAFLNAIYRYDHYLDPSRRTESLVVPLGYDNLGLNPRLDQNTAEMTLPRAFAADEDYLYVVYLDRGPDARVRGEVTIFDARDGHKVGWIVPGDETGHYSGAIDLVNPIQAITRSNGERLLLVEENGAGKVMVYRWSPPDRSAAN